MGQILWIMGPTSSGKTTTSQKLLAELKKNNLPVIHYDGDEVRNFFGDSLGFESKDRLKVVSTLVYLANKNAEAGLTVIVSALTANQDARVYIQEHARNLKIIYVQCSIEKCIERDPKGLYKKAQAKEIDTLAGFNSEYKPPENPDFTIDTENSSLEQNVTLLVKRYF